MIEAVLSFKFNSLLGALLYWLPLAICVFGYTLRTAKNYMNDRTLRETPGEFYTPTDTLGTLIGRAVVSVIPVANIWAGMFDLSPELFRSLFRWLDRFFNIPLVPDTEAAKVKRKAK